MIHPSDKPAVMVLNALREQLDRLRALEQDYHALRAERLSLENTIETLEPFLQECEGIKRDWEWFFDQSLDMKSIITLDGYFSRVNPAICRVLGFTEEELLSRPFMDFIHPDDLERTAEEFVKLQRGENTQHFENRYRDKQGNWHWISWCCPPFTADSKQLYAIARDITDTKKAEEALRYQASHDSLTGLRNRHFLEQDLHAAMKRCDCGQSAQLVTILIDLNDFKLINDTHGHLAGDYVLQELAGRFSQMKQPSDLIFRLGGDEFVWVIENVTPSACNEPIAAIQQAISTPVIYGELTLTVNGSVGIARYPGSATSAAQLLAQADQAMYQTKSVKKYSKS